MRVAYLCNAYPRATDTFVRREIAALRERGHEVVTISVRRPAPLERGGDELQGERDATRYLLPCTPWRLLCDHAVVCLRAPLRYVACLADALLFTRSPGVRGLLYGLFYFAEAGLVAAHARRVGVTHVHNHAPDTSGYAAMFAARMGGGTYSLVIHGFGALAEPRRCNLTEKIERALFVNCISSFTRSQAMLWSDPRHWPRLRVVRCGVDTAAYPARDHGGTGRRLLFVGRLDRVKGLPVLLDALRSCVALCPETRLDIVGDGPERARLEAQVRDLGLVDSVRFVGYEAGADVSRRIGESDVVVMSSFVEGIPVALMEAMAAGVPVVAPRITGIPELVEDGVHGLLFTPADASEMSERIVRLLRDPELRARLGAAAREKVKALYDVHVVGAELERVFREFLGASDRDAGCAASRAARGGGRT